VCISSIGFASFVDVTLWFALYRCCRSGLTATDRPIRVLNPEHEYYVRLVVTTTMLTKFARALRRTNNNWREISSALLFKCEIARLSWLRSIFAPFNVFATSRVSFSALQLRTCLDHRVYAKHTNERVNNGHLFIPNYRHYLLCDTRIRKRFELHAIIHYIR